MIVIPSYQPQRQNSIEGLSYRDIADPIAAGANTGLILAGVPQGDARATLALKLQALKRAQSLDPTQVALAQEELKRQSQLTAPIVTKANVEAEEAVADQPFAQIRREAEAVPQKIQIAEAPDFEKLSDLQLGNKILEADTSRQIQTGAQPALVTGGIKAAENAAEAAKTAGEVQAATAPKAPEAAQVSQEALISGEKEKKAAADWGTQFYNESGQGNFGSEMQPVVDPQSGAVLKYRYLTMGTNGPEWKEVDPFKATPDQVRAGKFATDIADAENVIAKHTVNGFQGFVKNKFEEMVPNAWKSPEEQEFLQAVNVLVHAANKADYSRPMLDSKDPEVKTEVKKVMERMVPKPGDSAAVLTRKAAARKSLFESLKAEAVGQANPVREGSNVENLRYFKSVQDAEQSGYKGRAMVFDTESGSYKPATVQ